MFGFEKKRKKEMEYIIILCMKLSVRPRSSSGKSAGLPGSRLQVLEITGIFFNLWVFFPN